MWPKHIGAGNSVCALFVGEINVTVAFKSFCDEGFTKLRPLCALNLSDVT